MAKTKTVRVSDEELELLNKIRSGMLETAPEPDVKEVAATEAQQALANALVSAIERTKAPTKKTVFSRKRQTPWTPPPGVPELKLKRKMYQHGILISGKVTNEEIDLLNKVRPGVYCDGYVRVNLRKDRGLDIDYPVKTNSQRLKLINQYGIRSFTELLQRIVDEKANPTRYRKPEDNDLYDLES